MANTGQSIKYEAIREIAFGALTNAYQTIGGPLTRGAFRIVLTNTTDSDVYFSVDGVMNQKKVPAFSSRIYDNKTNDMRETAGQQYYVKYSAAPSKGWVALEVEYV
jgi:hypothetical protein